MPVKLSSSGGGSVTLDTPSTASNYTVTLPAATSTLIDTTSTQTLTNKTLTAAGSNTVEATSGPTSTQLGGMRNKIINGAMMIDQRNAGASVAITTSDNYITDRFFGIVSANSKLTGQQNAGSVTPPVGFVNYLGMTVAASANVTVGATDLYVIGQQIEGLNCSDLAWGTASAATVTLSFWVRSSITGTFGGSLRNSGATRSYPFTYTISAANTWEQKSVIIAGDTSGTWLTTNGIGIRLIFGLGVGSTYSGTAGSWAGANYVSATGATKLIETNGATFYITGVQLEKGATATPFENRLYGTELALCQRYYQQFIGSGGHAIFSSYGATYNYANWIFKVTMRATPTIAGYTNGTITVNSDSAATYSAGSTYGSFGYNGTAYGTATASAEL